MRYLRSSIAFSLLSVLIGAAWITAYRNIDAPISIATLAAIPLVIGALAGLVIAVITDLSRIAGIALSIIYLLYGSFLVVENYFDQRLIPDCRDRAFRSLDNGLDKTHLSAWCIRDRTLNKMLERAELRSNRLAFEYLLGRGARHKNPQCARLNLNIQDGLYAVANDIMASGTSATCKSLGRTPLATWFRNSPATVDQQLEMLERLLAKGATVEPKHLLIALRAQHAPQIREALLRVDPNTGTDVATLDSPTHIEHPLALAIKMSDSKSVELLIEAGADPAINLRILDNLHSSNHREVSLLSYARNQYAQVSEQGSSSSGASVERPELQAARDIIAMLEQYPDALLKPGSEIRLVKKQKNPGDGEHQQASTVDKEAEAEVEPFHEKIAIATLTQHLSSFSAARSWLNRYAQSVNALLSADAPLPIFLSGPYPEGILNRERKGHFGHYNPAFLRWTIDNLIKQDSLDALYHPDMKELLRTLYEQGEFLRDRPALLADYVAHYRETLESGEELRGYYYRHYREAHGGTREATGVAFWVRRQIDGSAPYFEEIFEQLMIRYDYDHWLSLQKTRQAEATPGVIGRETTPTARPSCEVSAEYQGAIPERLFGYLHINQANPDEARIVTSNDRHSQYPEGDLPCVPNTRIWLFNEGKVVTATIQSASISRSTTEQLNLTIKAASPLQSGIEKGQLFRHSSYVYLSRTSIPEQTWRSSNLLHKSHKQAIKQYARKLGINDQLRSVRSRLVTTGQNIEYLLVSYTLAHAGSDSCQNTYNCVITLLLKSDQKGNWTIENEFRNANYGRPYVDTNGDGMPEFIGITGYKSVVLSSLLKPEGGKDSYGFQIDSGV